MAIETIKESENKKKQTITPINKLKNSYWLNYVYTSKDFKDFVSILLTLGLLLVANSGVNKITEINTNLNELKASAADIDSLKARVATIENLSSSQIQTNKIMPNCLNGTSGGGTVITDEGITLGCK